MKLGRQTLAGWRAMSVQGTHEGQIESRRSALLRAKASLRLRDRCGWRRLQPTDPLLSNAFVLW